MSYRSLSCVWEKLNGYGIDEYPAYRCKESWSWDPNPNCPLDRHCAKCICDCHEDEEDEE